MKIIREGHRYELANFENKEGQGQILQFIEKQPVSPVCTVLETVNDGTTNEEVIEALINRMQYLNGKFPCKENAMTITKLQEAKFWLRERTEDREKRSVEGKHIA